MTDFTSPTVMSEVTAVEMGKPCANAGGLPVEDIFTIQDMMTVV